MAKKTEKRELLVTPKSAFGREMYQVEDDIGQIFAELVGQKGNLTLEQLKLIKRLGYEVKIKQPDI